MPKDPERTKSGRALISLSSCRMRLSLRGDGWPFGGPSTLRPTFHDCWLITGCKKCQRLVICLLLCFEAGGGNSDLQSGIIIFYFKSHINQSLLKCCFSFFFFKGFLFGSVMLGKPISYTVAQGIKKLSQLHVQIFICIFLPNFNCQKKILIVTAGYKWKVKLNCRGKFDYTYDFSVPVYVCARVCGYTSIHI